MSIFNKLTEVPYIRNTNAAVTNVKDLFGVESNPYSVIVTHGIHHNCYYDIIVPIPTTVVNMIHAITGSTISGATLAERLNYYCTEVNVPASSISSTPIRVGGESIEIPYDRTYGEFQTTFYVEGGYEDDGGMTMKTIQGWLDTIYPPITRNFAYPDEYTTTIKIAMYTTPDGNPLFGKENIVILNLMEAWPASVQASQLSGRTGNEPTSFVVTWKYRYCIAGNMDGEQSTLSGVIDFVKNGFRLARSVNNIFDDAKNTYNSLKDAWRSIRDWF